MINEYKDSPLGKIPKNWDVEKLGKLAKTFAGGTPKRGVTGYYGGSIPWIKSGEVNNNSIEGAEEHVTELALKESSTKLIEANSILVALYGATAGKVGVLKVMACSNQAVLAVSSKHETT
jgi:type I restriction enzyme S subunit